MDGNRRQAADAVDALIRSCLADAEAAVTAATRLPVLAGCPECDAPAEVEHMATLSSTSGRMAHVRVRCVRRHWFLLPAEDVPGL